MRKLRNPNGEGGGGIGQMLILLALLGGAGFGAYWYLFRRKGSEKALAVETNSVTNNSTGDTVTLNGQLLSMGDNTTADCWFEWGVDTSYGTSTDRQTLAKADPFSKAITGLTAGQTYHYRAVALGIGGIIPDVPSMPDQKYGLDMPFVAGAAPPPNGDGDGDSVFSNMIRLYPALGTAMLIEEGKSIEFRLRVTHQGGAGTYQVGIGLAPNGIPSGHDYLVEGAFWWKDVAFTSDAELGKAYDVTIPIPAMPFPPEATHTDTWDVLMWVQVVGGTHNTDPDPTGYYYAPGENWEDDVYKVTPKVLPPPEPPVVTIQQASSVTTNSALLNATLVSMGGYAGLHCLFEYGIDTNYGNYTDYVFVIEPQAFAAPTLSPLLPNTTYHCRAWAKDAAGAAGDDPVAWSADSTFKTLSIPTPTIYTLTIQSGAGGITSPSPATYEYNSGSRVHVQAYPNTGYNFSHWTGDVTGVYVYYNPISVLVDKNKIVKANFAAAPVQQFTVTFAASAGGTVIPLGTYEADAYSLVNVTAIPASGYKFVGWSGNWTGTTNPDQIQITMDGMYVMANFSKVAESGIQLYTGWNNGIKYTGKSGTPSQVFASVISKLGTTEKPIWVYRDGLWYTWHSLPPIPPQQYWDLTYVFTNDLCYIYVTGNVFWTWL